MSFLPEDYTAPKSTSYYTKLQEGENRIRILSKPILGWEDWHEKKPVRYTMNEKPAKSYDAKKPVRHFWAFVVFNYNENEIQIMQITQATIRKSIESLCKDADWGAPFGYDIKIMKSGEGVDTEYALNPVPHKPVSQDIIDAFNDRRCNLNALFATADPFSKEWNEYTELATIETTNPENPGVSFENISELKEMFDECDPEYQKSLLLTLAKLPKPVKKIEDVPLSMFERIKQAVKSKRDEYRATNHDIFAVA
jgi:hypothetical protein